MVGAKGLRNRRGALCSEDFHSDLIPLGNGHQLNFNPRLARVVFPLVHKVHVMPTGKEITMR